MASTGFAANPTIVQRRGKRGNFELIVANADGSALHNLTRDNNISKLYPWKLTKTFALDIGTVTGLSVIEGPFNTPPNLELIVNNGGRLLQLNNSPDGNWSSLSPVTDAPVTGVPAFYQANSGERGDFEVVAPSEKGGLVWLWRNNNGSGPYPWSKPSFFGQSLGTVTSADVISNPNFIELVVTVGTKLHYFWRAIDRTAVWNGPSPIRPEVNITPNVALLSSTLGPGKHDFVLVVPSPSGGLLSFQRDNSLPTFPWSTGTPFGTNLGVISGITFIHGNLGTSENNLEGVVIARGVLYLFTHPPIGPWSSSSPITWK